MKKYNTKSYGIDEKQLLRLAKKYNYTLSPELQGIILCLYEVYNDRIRSNPAETANLIKVLRIMAKEDCTKIRLTYTYKGIKTNVDIKDNSLCPYVSKILNSILLDRYREEYYSKLKISPKKKYVIDPFHILTSIYEDLTEEELDSIIEYEKSINYLGGNAMLGGLLFEIYHRLKKENVFNGQKQKEYSFLYDISVLWNVCPPIKDQGDYSSIENNKYHKVKDFLTAYKNKVTKKT